MAEETKIIRIVVDSSKAVDGSAAATRAWERMERSQAAAASTLDRMDGALRRIGGFLAGTLGARAILQAADAFTALTNAIKVTGAEGSSLAFVQERLFAAANKNGVEIGALGQLYSRTALAGKELGISQERLLEFVDGVTAALRVQGGSTAQASGALLQLSQALGSGTVRAEEFNSILEGALPIAQAAARGMDGMGGSVAKLRTAIIGGTVTSQQFFEATMKGFGETRKAAEGASLTIGQAVTALSNSLTSYVGSVDKASGASAGLAKAIAGLGQALDDAGKDAKAGDSGLFDLSKVLASTVKEFEAITGMATAAGKAIADFAKSAGAYVTDLVDNIEVEGARASASFVEAFRALPEALGQLFTNAWEAARVASAKGINAIIDAMPDWMRPGGRLDTTPRGTAPVGAGMGAGIAAAGDAAAADVRARIDQRRAINRQASYEDDEARARLGGMPVSGPLGLGGGGGGGATGAGKAAENAAKKYAELTAELELTAAAQAKMTEAARGGEVAFQKQEATLQAQQKMLDIFKIKLEETDPRLTKIRDLLLSIAQGKAAEAFATATTELEKQNVVLEAQIRLMNEAPEIQAREIALIKAKNDAEKAGGALTAEDIDRRRVAIEQNERLKLQQDELRKAQELWTEPLKQALRDIQSTAADAFQQMLESGNFSFEALGQTFKKIITRMAAEFLALATIRPVMSVLVNAVSPGFAQQMGLGSTGLGGIGGGGMSMPSMGGGNSLGGGWLGGIGDFLNTPFTGPYAGMSPSSMAGVPMLSPSIMSPSSWGITPMQGLGAAAGIGMGAYQLLAGNGSTASTIGGIGSMIGGAVSLIPGVGQIAGPAIAILSSILPSLIGESKPTITDQGYGQVSYGGSGFGTSGGAWGPNANAQSLTGPLGQVGTTMQAVFNAFGGVKEAGRVWGVALESFSQQYGDDSSFSNQTSFLLGPNGQRQQWGQGSNASDIGMEAAGVAAALNSILGGAVGEISENMRKALGTVNQSGKDTFETLSAVVTEIMAFDAAIAGLGKTMTSAEQGLAEIDTRFSSIYATAEKFGLDSSAVTLAKDAERGAFGTSFVESIMRELDDPQKWALIDLDRWFEDTKKNNQHFVDSLIGYQNQIVAIEQLYAQKRADIIEQTNAASIAAFNALAASAASNVNTIQGLIRELSPGGALSNLDPAGQLAGLRASAGASLAQAFANPTDTGLIDRAVADQRAFLEANRSFTGGSTAYVRDAQSAVGQLQSLEGAVTRGAMSGTGDPVVRNLLQQLLAAVQAANTNSAKRNSDIDKAMALLARRLANEAA